MADDLSGVPSASENEGGMILPPGSITVEQFFKELAVDEALERYPEPWDAYNECRVDDWGYTEVERSAFIEGARWAWSVLK